MPRRNLATSTHLVVSFESQASRLMEAGKLWKCRVLLLLLGLTLLGWLIWKLGAAELWRISRSLGSGISFLVVGEGLAEVIHTFAWRRCLVEPQRSLPWLVLFRVRMAGYAVNYFTPMVALGGEAARAVLLASNHWRVQAVTGVLLGKLCCAAGHVLIVMVTSAFIMWHVQLPPQLWATMLLGLALVGGGVLACLLLLRGGHFGCLLRWFFAPRMVSRGFQNAAGELTRVDEALKASFKQRPGDLRLAVSWHLLGYAVGIFQAWLFLRLLLQPVFLASAVATWSLGMWFDLLTLAVPLNLGTLEGSRVVIFSALGYGAVLGMAYGLALRFAQLFWAAFGWVNLILLIFKKDGLYERTGFHGSRFSTPYTKV